MSTLKWNGAAVTAKMRRAAVDGLTEGVDLLASKSQEDVPVSPYARGGYLRGTMQKAVDGGQLIGAVGYDGGSVDSRTGKGGNLAILVHERMNIHHSTGHAKYLEKALNESKDTILRKIAAGIKAKTGM